ncbi:MAG: Fe2+/Zn2+ uptake regulation protein [Gemmataceae bacterium]
MSSEAACTAMDDSELRHALESCGWRYTRQRAAVYRYLQSVRTHPTAEEVYMAVRREIPKISLATVYKSLEALVACRLASRLDYGEGPARYDYRTDNHYHVRCLRTGKVCDLPVPHDPDLLSKLAPDLVKHLQEMGFQVIDYRLELVGYFSDSLPEGCMTAGLAADASDNAVHVCTS